MEEKSELPAETDQIAPPAQEAEGDKKTRITIPSVEDITAAFERAATEGDQGQQGAKVAAAEGGPAGAVSAEVIPEVLYESQLADIFKRCPEIREISRVSLDLLALPVMVASLPDLRTARRKYPLLDEGTWTVGFSSGDIVANSSYLDDRKNRVRGLQSRVDSSSIAFSAYKNKGGVAKFFSGKGEGERLKSLYDSAVAARDENDGDIEDAEEAQRQVESLLNKCCPRSFVSMGQNGLLPRRGLTLGQAIDRIDGELTRLGELAQRYPEHKKLAQEYEDIVNKEKDRLNTLLRGLNEQVRGINPTDADAEQRTAKIREQAGVLCDKLSDVGVLKSE